MQTQEPRYPVTGKEGAPIDLETAARWTRNYRHLRPNERISHLFGHEILQKILQQEGCLGIRMYYANSLSMNAWQRFIMAISNFLRKQVADAEGEEHLILVGTTREGKDQLPDAGPVADGEKALRTAGQEQQIVTAALRSSAEHLIAEQSNPCPGSPGCPQNALTS